jgi:hypothetical protein
LDSVGPARSLHLPRGAQAIVKTHSTTRHEGRSYQPTAYKQAFLRERNAKLSRRFGPFTPAFFAQHRLELRSTSVDSFWRGIKSVVKLIMDLMSVDLHQLECDRPVLGQVPKAWAAASVRPELSANVVEVCEGALQEALPGRMGRRYPSNFLDTSTAHVRDHAPERRGHVAAEPQYSTHSYLIKGKVELLLV